MHSPNYIPPEAVGNPIEYYPIEADTTGDDNEIVEGVAGEIILVLGYLVMVDVAGELTWKSANDSGDSTLGILVPDANLGAAWAGPVPAFETERGDDLVLTTDTGQSAYGHIAVIRYR